VSGTKCYWNEWETMLAPSLAHLRYHCEMQCVVVCCNALQGVAVVIRVMQSSSVSGGWLATLTEEL